MKKWIIGSISIVLLLVGCGNGDKDMGEEQAQLKDQQQLEVVAEHLQAP